MVLIYNGYDKVNGCRTDIFRGNQPNFQQLFITVKFWDKKNNRHRL